MTESNNDSIRKKILKIYYNENFNTKIRTLPIKEVYRQVGGDQNNFNANINYLIDKKLIFRPESSDIFHDFKILYHHYYWITEKGIDFIEDNKKSFNELKENEKNSSIQTYERPQIFIGHGKSYDWRDLKDHLHDVHKYDVIAYEIGSQAGHSIKEVLEKMLTKSSFALLVFTPEDEDKNGRFHARENVIHELGLFQGKLGFNKTIALFQKGVEEFSNIHGINRIEYTNKIKETFGDIIAVINREFPQ